MENQLLRVNAQPAVQECTRLEQTNFLEDPSKETYPSRDNKKTPPFWKGFFYGLFAAGVFITAVRTHGISGAR